ncbi:MAG: hypothetical protein FD180_308 [Planctomycetota bacterium]|nr:MAG: hypothetical protein FD180_308 [Planctomycetota bacterium]
MKRPIFFTAAVALQVAVLASMTRSHSLAVRDGTRVTMRVVPIDPEDLFRGQYVRLGYDHSRLDLTKMWEGPRPVDGGEIWLRLEPREGAWTATAARSTRGEPKPGAVWMRGHCGYLNGNTALTRFGIEEFYVREGRGPEIEREVRSGAVFAEVAVGDDGKPTLTALIVNGERIE